MSSSFRGKLLIAARHLRDPNFFQSVVLLVEHGETGAMGVVINRPSGVTISEALKNNFDLPETGEMVYVGGPVERNALFILHDAAEIEGTDSPIVDGLFVGSSPAAFEGIVRRAAAGDSTLRFRVYFGCAGWAPGQLEGELARNDWFVCPADRRLVFHQDPYAVWNLSLDQYHQVNPLMPGARGNPEWN